MSETKKAPEKVRLMRPDGSIATMDPAAATQAMRLRDQRTGAHQYVPLDNMVGFQRTSDGGTVTVDLSPAQAQDVALRQGAPGYNTFLALGPGDPRFKEADIYRRDRALTEIAKSRGSMRVAAERAVNIMSFGGYGALMDDNPAEAEIRARQNLHSPFASAAGTILGSVGTVLFPYGRFAGVLGKGAMAAGKATGMVRATQLASSASKVGKYSNVISRGALVGEAARDTGKSLFAKNFIGTMATAAPIELTTAIAIEAANITDYNKPFSAQALVADAGALFLTGMAFTGVLAGAGATLRSAGAGIRGGVERAGRRAAMEGGVERGAGRGAVDLVHGGMSSYFRRKSHQIGGPAAGTILNTMAQRAVRASRSKLVRQMTGESVDAFRGSAKTIRRALSDIRKPHMTKAQLVDAIGELGPKLPGRHGETLMTAADNAEWIVNARRTIDITTQHMPKYGDELTRYVFPEIKGVNWNLGAVDGIEASIKRVASEARKMGSRKLAKQIEEQADAIVLNADSGPRVLEHLHETKKLLREPGFEKVRTNFIKDVDESIRTLSGSDTKVMQMVNDFDAFTKSLTELDEMLHNIDAVGFTGGGQVALDMAEHTQKLADTARRLEMPKETIASLSRDAASHNADTMLYGMEQLTDLNSTVRALETGGEALRSTLGLSDDAFASVMANADDLLDVQVRTIMDFKRSTMDAIKYVFTAGSSPTAPIAFEGVAIYRQMGQAEKRQAFVDTHDAILATSATPEVLMGAVAPTAGYLAATDIEVASHYASTLATANSYMLQQLPRSADPEIGPESMSMTEIDSFFEIVGALESPASVIAAAADGSVSVESVAALRTVMPELYADMVLDVAAAMNLPEWDNLTEAQKIGFDTFTGGALGVLQSWGPMPGPLFAQTPLQQQALGTNMQQSSPEMARLQAKVGSTGLQKVEAL